MTPDDGDDHTDDDREDRNPRPGGLFESLLDLVRALDDLDDDRTSGSGRVEGTRSSIDFDYDIRVGIGGDRDGGHERDRTRRSTATVDAGDVPDLDDGVSVYDVAEYDHETVVTADLPGATGDEVGVSLAGDGTTLVVERDGEAVERVPLDRPAAAVDEVRFRNQVLTVHLDPAGGDDGTTGEGDDV